ncbi:hypothetical protein B9Z19DRAFT_1123985 [Tuber borchii]|uniref:Diphosphomevalonate decarboxylase-like N-terminal domain-containing protein n=1 Tax=Tuber borchii TaxID=42251 RepID=A0A2T6ZXG2_TUBBO|nr:hypothetical protein B9Z19DRAFT_1123985 [Tuber borchii]
MANKVYTASTTAPVNIAVANCVFTPPAPDSVPSDPAGSSSPLPLPLIILKSNNALPNIFLNKYWPKRDTELNLPTNTSFSQADLRTNTTAASRSTFTVNSLWPISEAQDDSGAQQIACFANSKF